MLAGQGPNERLPAASAAAWAPRPGPRPGPPRVRRACVSARGRRLAQCACAGARAAAPSQPFAQCACAPSAASWPLVGTGRSSTGLSGFCGKPAGGPRDAGTGQTPLGGRGGGWASFFLMGPGGHTYGSRFQGGRAPGDACF